MGQQFVMALIGYALTKISYPFCLPLHVGFHQRYGNVRLLLGGAHEGEHVGAFLVRIWLKITIGQWDRLKREIVHCSCIQTNWQNLKKAIGFGGSESCKVMMSGRYQEVFSK